MSTKTKTKKNEVEKGNRWELEKIHMERSLTPTASIKWSFFFLSLPAGNKQNLSYNVKNPNPTQIVNSKIRKE